MSLRLAVAPSLGAIRAEVMGRGPDMPGRWSWEYGFARLMVYGAQKHATAPGDKSYELVKSWPRTRPDGCRQSETGPRRLAGFRSTVLRASRSGVPALAIRDARSRDCVADRCSHIPGLALWSPLGPAAQAVALGGDARDTGLDRWCAAGRSSHARHASVELGAGQARARADSCHQRRQADQVVGIQRVLMGSTHLI